MRGRVLPVGLMLLLAVGCASYIPRPDEIRDVRADLVDIDVEKASLTELEFEVAVRVTNPNDFDLRIEYLEVGLDISGTRLSQGSTKGFTIAKYDDKEAKIPVHMSTLAISLSILNLIESKEFTYTMSAEVTYKTREGPLRRALPDQTGTLGR